MEIVVVRRSHQRCSVKKVFLEISKNSQENTCARDFSKRETLAQVFCCEFSKVSTNNFFYRTPLVAASVVKVLSLLNTGVTSTSFRLSRNYLSGMILLFQLVFKSIGIPIGIFFNY